MKLEVSNLVAHLDSVSGSEHRPNLTKSVLPTLVECIHAIALRLRSAPQVAAVGSSNAFGDDQLNVDVLAENIIRNDIQKCPAVVTASSEEDPIEKPVREGASSQGLEFEQYTIAFDPLDGSSIIAPNWTVGTIIGIWDGPCALNAKPSEKQAASVLGMYGPRTTIFIAMRTPGGSATCFELGLSETEETSTIEIVRPQIHLSEPPFETRYFAPANLRAAAEDEKYSKLISHYISNKYTLRYSGGLVPDVVHALVKGHGVYVSPVTAVSKAKLRRLYELAPIALIMECAGGSAVDPATGEDILARPIADCDERGGLVCGTKEEVDSVRQSLL